MYLVKSTAILRGIDPELLAYLTPLGVLYNKMWQGKPYMTITSGVDGIHKGTSGYDEHNDPPSNSKHYVGRAVDIRGHNNTLPEMFEFVDAAKEAFERRIYFLLEGYLNGVKLANFHLHIHLID